MAGDSRLGDVRVKRSADGDNRDLERAVREILTSSLRDNGMEHISESIDA